ncbi:MAG: hypothetical protein LLG15_06775 [Betaproteobacteria bacterium]|nr:hypothetical protein [Betaproteobacteria bacterium]
MIEKSISGNSAAPVCLPATSLHFHPDEIKRATLVGTWLSCAFDAFGKWLSIPGIINFGACR